jgi:hypothetical protein
LVLGLAAGVAEFAGGEIGQLPFAPSPVSRRKEPVSGATAIKALRY